MDSIKGDKARAWRARVAKLREAGGGLFEARVVYQAQLAAVQAELEEAWDELQVAVASYREEAGRAAVLLEAIMSEIEQHHDERDSWHVGRVAWVHTMQELLDDLRTASMGQDERPELDTEGTMVQLYLDTDCADMPTRARQPGGG